MTPEQLAREAAADIMQSCNYSRDLNGNDVKQIILAAIYEATKVELVDEPPTVPGWYWWRWTPEDSAEVVCVEIGEDGRYWYGDDREPSGQWSSKPIQEPE